MLSSAEIEKAHKGATTKVFDLSGKTLLPGFIDAHSHCFSGCSGYERECFGGKQPDRTLPATIDPVQQDLQLAGTGVDGPDPLARGGQSVLPVAFRFPAESVEVHLQASIQDDLELLGEFLRCGRLLFGIEILRGSGVILVLDGQDEALDGPVRGRATQRIFVGLLRRGVRLRGRCRRRLRKGRLPQQRKTQKQQGRRPEYPHPSHTNRAWQCLHKSSPA